MRIHATALCCAALAIGGCASGVRELSLLELARRDLGDTAQDATEQSPEASPLGLQSGTQDDAAVSKQAPVSLDALTRLAIARNPEIRAARRKVRRLAQRVTQARSLPDPRFSIAPLGQMAETAAGQVELMASASQTFPAPGKLDAQARLAQQEVEIARAELAQTQLRIVRAVRQARWRLYAAAQSARITRENMAVLDQALQIVQARLAAGVASQDAALRLSVERIELDRLIERYEQERVQAQADLNALLDRPAEAPFAAMGVVDVPDVTPDVAKQAARAAQAHPLVVAQRKRVQRFREARVLAALDRVPDVTLSASFNAVEADGLSPVANGRDQWWFGFSINLPVWTDRLDAQEREATLGALEAAASQQAASREVERRLADALAQARSLHAQALLLRDEIVPQAQQAVEAALASFAAGEGDFLTVIDHWRRSLAFSLALETTKAGLGQALAAIDEALGEPKISEYIKDVIP